MKNILSITFYLFLLLFFGLMSCQQKEVNKSQSKLTEKDDRISYQTTKKRSLLSVKPKNYYIHYYGLKDSVFRYYPDAGIQDSLAVVEGLKTKVFGIAVSLDKKNVCMFIN